MKKLATGNDGQRPFQVLRRKWRSRRAVRGTAMRRSIFIRIAIVLVLGLSAVALGPASSAYAYTCGAGATSPVLEILENGDEYGYSGTISTSASVFCSKLVTSVKITAIHRISNNYTGPYVESDKFSVIRTNSHDSVATAVGPCSPGKIYHDGHGIGFAADFAEGAETASGSSSGILQTDCNRIKSVPIKPIF